MPAYTPRVIDLCEYRQITRKRVAQAADAYLASEITAPFRLSDRFVLDVAQAVQEHGFAAALVRDASSSPSTRREAVCAAILLARPARG